MKHAFLLIKQWLINLWLRVVKHVCKRETTVRVDLNSDGHPDVIITSSGVYDIDEKENIIKEDKHHDIKSN